MTGWKGGRLPQYTEKPPICNFPLIHQFKLSTNQPIGFPPPPLGKGQKRQWNMRRAGRPVEGRIRAGDRGSRPSRGRLSLSSREGQTRPMGKGERRQQVEDVWGKDQITSGKAPRLRTAMHGDRHRTLRHHEGHLPFDPTELQRRGFRHPHRLAGGHHKDPV